VVALLVGLAACGGDATDATDSLDDPTVQSPPSTSAPVQGPGLPTGAPAPGAASSCDGAPAVSPAPAGSTTDLTKKPSVPKGPATVDALVVADVVTGTGAAACAGSALTVRYVGVLADGGKQFDASWDRGADSTFPFTLGEGSVIQGWDRGLVGMRVGGRRQLTIPAAQGYGDGGAPPDIPGGASLVFVVDLVKVE
jgi:FKBP-type peptidyl-prolyl cis-trans isomerase